MKTKQLLLLRVEDSTSEGNSIHFAVEKELSAVRRALIHILGETHIERLSAHKRKATIAWLSDNSMILMSIQESCDRVSDCFSQVDDLYLWADTVTLLVDE